MAQPPDWLARRMVEVPGEGPDGRHLPQQFGDLVVEDRPAVTWADFQGWVAELDDRWSFRGHAVANWRLEAALERATTPLVAASIGFEFHISRQRLRPGIHEKELLLEFQRGAHQYMSLTPDEDEVVDWLALMQHHGAPTRLLDWTRSPYVALYFALEKPHPKERSAIWAIDRDWMDKESSEAMRKHDRRCPSPSDFKAMCRYVNGVLLKEDNPTVVVPANPMRMNDRMTAQQGHFLCNLSHQESFDVSLSRMVSTTTAQERPVRKLVLAQDQEPDQRIVMLKELRRMNIHSASLFPGLDGFARSLGVELECQIEGDKDDWRRSFKKAKRPAREKPPKTGH